LSESVRYLRPEDFERFFPVHAVWELTLACDLKCTHCGSRAQKRRPDELGTEEALDVVRQLARLGTREITIIGGEAYLRKDWLEIIREIRKCGMEATMQSGGRNLTEERIRGASEAGLQAIGISLDGMEALHDEIRGVQGSFAAGVEALRCAKRYGLTTSVNTQITSRMSDADLRALLQLLLEVGASGWQIQLTVAMGRAADNEHLLLQPYKLRELMPLLYELYQQATARGLHLEPGNNIGYFGPYEAYWRGAGRDHVHWIGCNAGQNTIGIEADGTIKGCPSLPTEPYAGGNVRQLDIETIWNTSPALAFTRNRSTEDLWGFCKTCYYADVCRGGCSWTSHTLLGRPGNNPYCHHRVLELEKQGLRERIVKVKEAEGRPFDYGGFELVQEPIDAPAPEPRTKRLVVVR
jgi:Y-X(10)_GDL-associated radical SAM protein